MIFKVETGEGLDDATSYVDVDYADSRIAAMFPEDTQWSSKSTPQKQLLLMQSSSFIDGMLKWTSVLFLLTQRLSWPRGKFKDSEGRTIAEGEVPVKIKTAVVDLALESITADIFDEGVLLESQKYGSSSESYAGPERDGGNILVRQIMRDFQNSGYGRKHSSLIELQRA